MPLELVLIRRLDSPYPHKTSIPLPKKNLVGVGKTAQSYLMENTHNKAEVITAQDNRKNREERKTIMAKRILGLHGLGDLYDDNAFSIRSRFMQRAGSDNVKFHIRKGRDIMRQTRYLLKGNPIEKESLKEKYFKKFSGNLVSVELECVFHSDYIPPSQRDLPSCLVEVTGDASVTYQSENDESGSGREYKLTMRTDNPQSLKKVTEKLSSMGGEVNQTCGMHIHLDQRGISKVTATKRAKRLVKCLPALVKLVPPSRLSNRFCQQNQPIPKSGKYRFSSDRYRMINYIPAYRKHRTCEVRLHGGTLDFWKILGWIKLCQFIQNSTEIDRIANLAEGYYASVNIENLIRMESMPDSLRLYVWKRFRQFNSNHANALREKLVNENNIHLTDGMAIS